MRRDGASHRRARRPAGGDLHRAYDGGRWATGARAFLTVADDESGTSWGPREPLVFDPVSPTAYYPSGPPVQVDDDTFLMTGYGGSAATGWSSVGVVLTHTAGGWRVDSRTVLAQGSSEDIFTETYAMKRDDGRILALIRTDKWQGSTTVGVNIRSTVSSDDGLTWSSEQATDPDPADPNVRVPSDRPIGTFAFYGQGHPHLLETTDGRIYASYRRWATYPVVGADGPETIKVASRDAVYRASTDDGRTWVTSSSSVPQASSPPTPPRSSTPPTGSSSSGVARTTPIRASTSPTSPQSSSPGSRSRRSGARGRERVTPPAHSLRHPGCEISLSCPQGARTRHTIHRRSHPPPAPGPHDAGWRQRSHGGSGHHGRDTMNDTYVDIRGWVGTDLELKHTQHGIPFVTFRLASTASRMGGGGFVDGPTSWYSVTAWRGLAENLVESVQKGQPLMVHGRQRVVDWAGQTSSGTRVEIEATAVGHNLRYGTDAFVRVERTSSPADDPVVREAIASQDVGQVPDRMPEPFSLGQQPAGDPETDPYVVEGPDGTPLRVDDNGVVAEPAA